MKQIQIVHRCDILASCEGWNPPYEAPPPKTLSAEGSRCRKETNPVHSFNSFQPKVESKITAKVSEPSTFNDLGPISRPPMVNGNLRGVTLC